MNIREYALTLLNAEKLEDKLISPELVTNFSSSKIQSTYQQLLRPKGLEFSNKKDSFPKKSGLREMKNRGKAFHFFANHELLAIEIMALTLIRLQMPEALAKKILMTIADEQKHFKRYLERMTELGVEFGEYSLNDFFWRYAVRMQTLDHYFSLMPLTFENANLDFASYYHQIFLEFGDTQSAQIVEEVLLDEIHHVSLGVTELNKSKPAQTDLWSYYTSLLPSDLSPTRAKGITFFLQPRLDAGFDQDFLNNLRDYRGPLVQLNRKEWK